VRASVSGTDGDDLVLDLQGQKVAMPASRRAAGAGDELLVGIRPEKIRLRTAGDATATDRAHNVLPGGVVTDTSFTGVSTQYLVRMPWGQELMVFAQNLGVSGVHPPGTQVDLSWDPAHTFALDGSADATAGAELDDGAAPLPVG
jgi:spermidine/putrescine transport system ATP-binding protein